LEISSRLGAYYADAASQSLASGRRTRSYGRVLQMARIALLIVIACPAVWSLPGSNPGDPLYCQPNEGTSFLIVNGGAGVFTADSDCYNNNIANDTDTTIATAQGGVLTRAPGTGDYVYTPPTPDFVGLDTFQIHVTTVWNAAGGTGTEGGTVRPGGPATFTITLNVIPATAAFNAAYGTATAVPVPAGSIAGCSPAGNAWLGPAAGVVYGCTTGVTAGSVLPSHGTLTLVGGVLTYTPAAGYSGTDSFTFEVRGVNSDGNAALSSGMVTAQVTVGAHPATVPALGPWGLLLLCLTLLGFGIKSSALRPPSFRS